MRSELKKEKIWLNGPPINWDSDSHLAFNTKFCKQCGTETTDAYPNCNSRIQGTATQTAVIITIPKSAPSYCHECGSSYPWTSEMMKAAKESVELSTTIWNKNRTFDRSM